MKPLHCFSGIVWLVIVLLHHQCLEAASEKVTVGLERSDVPSGYLAYSIPPFAVTLTTLNTLDDNDSDSSNGHGLLGIQGVAKPLKRIVGQFVQESFALEVAERQETKQQTEQMLLNFVSTDFAVGLYPPQTSLQDNSNRRRLNDDYDDFYIDLYAEFQGLAFFVKPTEDHDIMSDSQVEGILGAWLSKYLDTDGIALLLDRLQAETAVPLLNNAQNVQVDFNAQVPDGDDGNNDNSDKNNSNGNAKAKENTWSQAVITSLVIVVCMALLVLGALLFRYSYPILCTSDPDNDKDGLSKADNGNNNSHSGAVGQQDTLPGRGHGDADEQVLMQRQSDLWLQKHRPDLYNAVQRAQQQQQQKDTKEQQLKQPPSNQRRSLPMQFVLGLFQKKNASPSPQQSDVENPIDESSSSSCSIVFNDEEEDRGTWAEQHHQDHHYGGWWNGLLVNMQGSKKTLACEEDPTQYQFPFQDFPRHDGTPCLIFNDDGDVAGVGMGMGPRERTDSSSSGNMNRPLSPTDLLSNEEFKKVLSLNSEAGGVPLDSEDEEEIHFPGPNFTDKLEQLISMRLRHYERQNILFKHKKKQQQQTQEQQEDSRIQQSQEEAKQLKLEQEARQRELRLRRHEMELDMNEIEAPFSTRRSYSSAFSTNTAIAVVTPLKKTAGNTSASNLQYHHSHSNSEGAASHKASVSDPDVYALSSGSSSHQALQVQARKCPAASDPPANIHGYTSTSLHRKQKSSASYTSAALGTALSNTNKNHGNSPGVTREMISNPKISQASRSVKRRDSEPRPPSVHSIFSSPPPAIQRTTIANLVSPEDEWKLPVTTSPTIADSANGNQQLLGKSNKPSVAQRQYSHRGSHRGSHRRSASHGTGALDTAEDDVMTFGIAAYSANFVSRTGEE